MAVVAGRARCIGGRLGAGAGVAEAGATGAVAGHVRVHGGTKGGHLQRMPYLSDASSREHRCKPSSGWRAGSL